MNISTETREILRNYKAVINARRRCSTKQRTKILGQHLPTSMCAMHMPDSLTQAPHTQVRTTQQQLQFCTLFAGCCLFLRLISRLYYII